MFKANCYAYIGFIVIVVILDYKDSIASISSGPWPILINNNLDRKQHFNRFYNLVYLV